MIRFMETQSKKIDTLIQHIKEVDKKISKLESTTVQPTPSTLSHSNTEDMLSTLLQRQLQIGQKSTPKKANFNKNTLNIVSENEEDSDPENNPHQQEHKYGQYSQYTHNSNEEHSGNNFNGNNYNGNNNFNNNKNNFEYNPYDYEEPQRPQPRASDVANHKPKFFEQTKFHGNENEDLEYWIFTMQMNFQINRTPEDLKLPFAQFYLKDMALVEFKSMLKIAFQTKKEIDW